VTLGSLQAGRPSRRRTRTLRGAVVLAGIAFGLSGCGSGSAALGNAACAHVQRSIELYAASRTTHGDAATRLATEANVQLRDAARPASLAASGDGEWEALAATLSESSRVAESNLITALRDECASSPAGTRAPR